MISVQKYGGSSLCDINSVSDAARHIAKEYSLGKQLVIVVSALKGVTDEILNRARSMNCALDKKNLAQLLSAGEQDSARLLSDSLSAIGVPSVALNGAQAKIKTTNNFLNASILNIDTSTILGELSGAKVVVVTGFQGCNDAGDITTLGRGGSDLSAVALAHALQAKECVFYKDVGGVFTADPFLFSQAKRYQSIPTGGLLKMAMAGSGLIQAKALKLAQGYNLDFTIRSLASDGKTKVCTQGESLECYDTYGIIANTHCISACLHPVKCDGLTHQKVLEALEMTHAPIYRMHLEHRSESLSFDFDASYLREVESLLVSKLQGQNRCISFHFERSSHLTVVFKNSQTTKEHYQRVTETLNQYSITPKGILCSEHSIHITLAQNNIQLALQVLHESFFSDAIVPTL